MDKGRECGDDENRERVSRPWRENGEETMWKTQSKGPCMHAPCLLFSGKSAKGGGGDEQTGPLRLSSPSSLAPSFRETEHGGHDATPAGYSRP